MIDYQEKAARTINWTRHDLNKVEALIAFSSIGISGEAGEIAEIVKKGIFHEHGLDKSKLIDEIGDLLWYVAALCTYMGVSLSDAMEMNIEKLEKRYPDGFTPEASLNRKI